MEKEACEGRKRTGKGKDEWLRAQLRTGLDLHVTESWCGIALGLFILCGQGCKQTKTQAHYDVV